MEFGPVSVLAVLASIFVCNTNNFILTNHHWRACHRISFDCTWDRLHICENTVFETTLHSFVVGDGPAEILSGEDSDDTVWEEHFGVEVSELADYDTVFGDEAVFFDSAG